jgi:hypothetical protein
MAKRAPDDPRCKDCPADREPGRARCAECAERHRKESGRVAKARRKAGLCVTCGAAAATGKRYCADDLVYFAERDARKRATAAAGAR